MVRILISIQTLRRIGSVSTKAISHNALTIPRTLPLHKTDETILLVLLWQDICWGYHAILVLQNSEVSEDSEVSCSRLPIILHYHA